jgi:uncharacterized membrane protein YeaQ/YmgE (transglycosylase-associated protein family)
MRYALDGLSDTHRTTAFRGGSAGGACPRFQFKSRSESMGIIAWIIFGALAGWITSKIAGTDKEQGWLMNIVLGIVGAIVGGFIWGLISDGDFEIGFNIGSLLVAILGGLIVSYLARFISRAA